MKQRIRNKGRGSRLLTHSEMDNAVGRVPITVRQSEARNTTQEEAFANLLGLRPPKTVMREAVGNIELALDQKDVRGGLQITSCYAQNGHPDLSPGHNRKLQARIRAGIMLASNNPSLWAKALSWYAEHGLPREQVYVCRLVLHKLGVEAVIRAWSDEGMSVREISRLLGPGYSKSKVGRITRRLEEEERMNAAVQNDLAALKLGQRMQGETLDEILKGVEALRARELEPVENEDEEGQRV
jgi:hypothetical protein